MNLVQYFYLYDNEVGWSGMSEWEQGPLYVTWRRQGEGPVQCCQSDVNWQRLELVISSKQISLEVGERPRA